MKPVAVIPARGGSKRLPRKNILDVKGAPMISYPIAAALESHLFETILVSTEDKEIAGVAEKYGAEVLERPLELATDRAGVVQVCSQVLETLEGQGRLPECFCCIYATALFITPGDLRDSFEKIMADKGPDVVMGVSEFNLQPVQALEQTPGGTLEFKWPQYLRVQSQFHPELVASNGTLYWARTRPFMENPDFYPKKLQGHRIPWIRAIDIDTPEDLENARRLMGALTPEG